MALITHPVHKANWKSSRLNSVEGKSLKQELNSLKVVSVL